MASEHVERKLAAIVAADVAGYSREGTLARLKAHRKALIDPKIAEHSGRIIKTTGDGMLVEFASVVDAVRCVVEIQRGMLERNADIPADRRIDFRVGINIGDIIVDGDDIYGDGVNIAARLESLAEPGGILVSGAVRDQVRDKLSFSFDDLGERDVKNIPRPVRAYRVNLSDDGAPTSPARPTGRLGLANRSIPWVAAAVLLAVVAGGFWYFFAANRSASVASNTPAPAETARLSIVVLPFANLSGDPAKDYLADALTDEMTTSIARIYGTFVIAHNTAMTFKGKPVDARAIGKDLGVRYLLEGSVQTIGAQMRVDAQLIDTASGAHVWAEQFDATGADLLQTQNEIVTHLANAMELQLTEAEAARLNRTPAANQDAEDLALRCEAAGQKSGYIGKEADAGYPLCEQALIADPNNVRALRVLALKFFVPASYGFSADPKADLKRADDLLSRALAVDPTNASVHDEKGWVLMGGSRFEETIVEEERALALNPADVSANTALGFANYYLGRFEKSREYFDKAIRLSPFDPLLSVWYNGKSRGYFALKQYDEAIDWARRSISVRPNYPYPHTQLIAALALTGHEAEAREALQHYGEIPNNGLRTIAALKVARAIYVNANSDPRCLEAEDRILEGLRKAGMPEE